MSSVGVLQRLGAIEIKQLETDKRIDTVFDALDRGNLLPSGILPAASEFDSLRHGLGSSINCLGRRVTSYTTRDPKEIAKLLAVC